MAPIEHKKRKRHAAANDEMPDKTEAELESLLFGSGDGFGATLGAYHESDTKNLDTTQDVSQLEDSDLFVVDTKAPADEAEPEESADDSASDDATQGDAPAWHDEDDDRIEVDLTAKSMHKKLRNNEQEITVSINEYETRLRQQFERIHGKPKWAETREEDDQSSSVFQTTDDIIERSRRMNLLLPDTLDVARVRDANWRQYHQSVVRSVDWHPNGQVLLTAGLDKSLHLFHIDGKENTKLQTTHFKEMPIFQAEFTPSGSEVILAGRRKFFYSYDVEKGKVTKIPGIQGRQEKSFEQFKLSPCGQYISFLGQHGDVIMLSAKTKLPISTITMNGTVRAIDFSADGQYLFSTGGDSDVYQWDLRMQNRCVHRFSDSSALKPSALAVSNGFIASGDESGMVNLYNSSECLKQTTPSPFKSIGNLTTYIDHVKFNHDSQLMAFASRVKKDQLRVAHLPSGRVYSNWPTANTPLGYVQCLDFSPNGGYLAIGNDKGKVLMYRLQHYGSS